MVAGSRISLFCFELQRESGKVPKDEAAVGGELSRGHFYCLLEEV